MDNRSKDALTCFSGWWRSWPLLAGAGRDVVDRPVTESERDESAHFAMWAAELGRAGRAAAESVRR